MIRFLKDIKKYWRYIIYSAQAMLKDEVAGSFLNWLWWILDPLLFMLVYTFVFSIVFGRAQDYLCSFIFIGLTTWNFFNRSVLSSVKIIKRYQPVLSKVYLPKFILIISNMMVNFFKMLIGYGLIFISMMIYRVPPTPQLLWVIPYLLLLSLMSFGVGSVLLHFGVYMEDLSNIVNVVLRLMFYLSGIFYNPEIQLKNNPIEMFLLTHLNPTCYLITQLRNSMLYGHMPDLPWFFAWTVIGVVISVIGVKLIYKYERRYVKSV